MSRRTDASRTSDHVTRRQFLKTSAGAAAAVAAGTFAVPAIGNVQGANDRIRIGVIGSGGRSRSLVRHALDEGGDGVEIVALCDVAEFRLQQAAADLQQRGLPAPEFHREHEALLDRDDIDAVIIGTPDHWHHDQLLAALDAGKDVYVEKPLSLNIEQGKNMVRAVRATDRIVQVGNHRRSGDHWARCRELIEAGELGELNWVRVYDTRNWTRNDPFAPPADFAARDQIDWERFCGPAGSVQFDPYKYFAWRWYWSFAGGLLTDIGAHWLDIAQWLTGHDEGPRSVVAHGGNYRFPQWETPDVVHALLDYGDVSVVFNVSFTSGNQTGDGAEVYGSEGIMLIGREVRVYKEFGPDGRPQRDTEPTVTFPAPYEGQAHVANWLQCLRTREQPNSPIEVGHRVITAAHLANRAYREGRRIEWDPQREEEVGT